VKLVHLVGFTRMIKKFVTIHSHVNASEATSNFSAGGEKANSVLAD
jgi:hypothetical protein